MKKSIATLSFACLGASLLGGHYALSQVPAPEREVRDVFAPVDQATITYRAGVAASRSPLAASQAETSKIVRKLRDNKEEAKRGDLIKELESAVSTLFDEDMKVRENEVTQLEERIAKLKVQLDRRRRAKPEITQLQVKVLVNEADGLGFANTPDRSDFINVTERFLLEEPRTVPSIAPPPPRRPEPAAEPRPTR